MQKPLLLKLRDRNGALVEAWAPERAARQMYDAYAVVVLGQSPRPSALGQAVEHHHWLKR